jgi:hypothetical protein
VIRSAAAPLFVLLVTIACARSEAPIETTICAIVADPAAFDKKVVRVSATFQSDGIEHSSLMDRACSKTTVAITSGPSDDAAHSALSSAVFNGRPGTFEKEIRGIFIGRFTWQKGKLPSRRIDLVTASDITMTPREGRTRRVGSHLRAVTTGVGESAITTAGVIPHPSKPPPPNESKVEAGTPHE